VNLNRFPQAPAVRRQRAGWTLAELMISVVAGLMMLISVSSVYIFMLRSLDATANYEELDRQSRNAVDNMSTAIRQAGALTNYSTNTLSFTNLDGSLLQYTWDNTNLMTYTNASTANGGPFGGTLLKDCHYLDFRIFQRNPSNSTTMDFWPTTNAALAKVILINWVCARTNYTTLQNSESVQTAKVVLRN